MVGRLTTLFVLAALPATAHAQRDSERTPPRVVRLEPVELPPELASGLEAIELQVRVDAQGHASILECPYSSEICALAGQAVDRAELEPARVEGAPQAARIGMRLTLARAGEAEAPDDSSPNDGGSADARDDTSATAEGADPSRDTASTSDAGELEFAAEARSLELRGARRFDLAEVRDVAGTFGDPLRALDTLPGVIPVASGIPYVYVRGAPPSSSLYLYDEVPLPMLFHFGIGSSIIHPRMLGPIRLYSGVSPTRYGRHLGGVLLGEGPTATAPPARPAGELELRLLDVNGYVEAPLGGGSGVALAARYGYPGLLISLFAPGVNLQYWDYQARADLRLDGRTRLQLVWLGSFDFLGVREDSGTTTETMVHFHRAELRLVRDLGNDAELGLALRGGFDESSIASSSRDALSVAFTTGNGVARIWASFREGPVRTRVGADIQGSFGRPSLRVGNDPDGPSSVFQSTGSAFARVAARGVGGAFAELVIAPDPSWELVLGARFDLWTAGTYMTGALDPRARFEVHATPGLSLHAALGVVRQPASFLIPLPGLADVPILSGLQTAIQGEIGGHYELGPVEMELQLFAHRYEGMAFVDFFFAAFATREICERPGGACSRPDPVPRTNGTSWGGELFARMPPTTDFPLSGWLSYTLSWNELDSTLGIVMRPSYDVRHVLNLVLQWRVIEGFTIAARLFVRSGSPRALHYTDMQGHPALIERELSAFVRLDAQLAYAWDAGWGRMRVSLDVFNATASQEAVSLSCLGADANGVPNDCLESRTPPIVAPNLGLRVEL